MRNVVNDNFSYVTAQFAYSGGTGYVTAYTGRTTERLWLNPLSIKGCKSRDEAELKALLFLLNGDPRKDTYAATGIPVYKGFTKNARVQLIGFDAFEKGIKQKHTKNTQMWKDVLELFSTGKNGFRFDLIRINDKFSGAIRNAETYGWTAMNREANDANFKAMVKNAKASRAATAKATPAPKAAAPHAPKASALTAKIEAAMAATATGVNLDEILEGVA